MYYLYNVLLYMFYLYCSTLNFVSAPAENASLPAKWFASVVKALRPTVENNKSGYCWPYCNASDGKCLVTFTKVIPYMVIDNIYLANLANKVIFAVNGRW